MPEVKTSAEAARMCGESTSRVYDLSHQHLPRLPPFHVCARPTWRPDGMSGGAAVQLGLGVAAVESQGPWPAGRSILGSGLLIRAIALTTNLCRGRTRPHVVL